MRKIKIREITRSTRLIMRQKNFIERRYKLNILSDFSFSSKLVEVAV